jgi:hypothetical protein
MASLYGNRHGWRDLSVRFSSSHMVETWQQREVA